jgi:hypothetical protein
MQQQLYGGQSHRHVGRSTRLAQVLHGPGRISMYRQFSTTYRRATQCVQATIAIARNSSFTTSSCSRISTPSGAVS